MIKDPLSEQFHQFDFLALPIGIYMTTLDGHFIECNTAVRKMFGLPMEGPINANIADFYADPGQRQKLVQQTFEEDSKGGHIERIPINFKVHGRDIYVEDYCKPLKDPGSGEILGFIGCFVDVTDEFTTKRHEDELRLRNEELVFDIGRILHANNTTLVMVIQTLNGLVQTLSPNPFGEATPSTEEADEVLEEHAGQLAGAIERFLQVADEERRSKALPEGKWRMLSEQIAALREFREKIPLAEARPATLRSVAHAIIQACQGVAPGFLPRESIRDLQQSAWQLEKITSVLDVLKTRSAVLQMDFTLQSLREYVTADVRDTAKKERKPVKTLIDQAVSRLTGFAQSSKVSIRASNIIEAEVEVNEREIVRAISNLLHNAIKYTWRRDRATLPWVSIRTAIREHKVSMEFENWGVPISREELEQGLVFTLGYRGRLSTDRGRLGTGIGLTDAKRVAQVHNGDILIESRPTRIMKQDDPEYYSQPFITTVTLTLPLAGYL